MKSYTLIVPFMQMTTATIHNALRLSAHWLNRNCLPSPLLTFCLAAFLPFYFSVRNAYFLLSNFYFLLSTFRGAFEWTGLAE